ncbi:TadE family type IV pilus minor pilin [Gordonia metallireducens]|uniref:TadE family type IV pilus minor pilin n=1 Tax=Gordonia metallireducens TaxID=2897779 RepID=UPI001E4C7009|nr:TadE family type IV pilus minor pilin [Gordonia metallireducens]
MCVHAWRIRLVQLGRDDDGMVTVEAAYAVAAIVVAVLLAVGAIGGVTAQIRCTDAAREAARLTAAGDDSAREVAKRTVGDRAVVSVSVQGERVVAQVRTSVPLLPGLTLSAQAVAAKEPRGEDEVVFAPGVEP